MSDWFEEASDRRKADPSYGYGRIAKDYGLTWDTVRSRFRREADKAEKMVQSLEPTKADEEIVNSPIDTKLYDIIKDGKKYKIDFLCNKLSVNVESLFISIATLKELGYNILVNDEWEIFLCRIIVPTRAVHTSAWSGEKIIRFGVTADPHTGSTHQQYTHLNTFYDLCEQEGIEDMYCAGDLTEGVNMRAGHSFECTLSGVDRQVNYVINNFPRRKRMHTKFIIGNHDASAIKSAGHDIGAVIAREREDMDYLGCLSAKIMLTPKCSLQLSHPIDGSSYALSYKIQRSLDAMSGGSKPSILAVGHYHKAFYMLYRNVHALTAGCFQAQTPWMEGKQIAAMMGGWIITAHVADDGSIRRFLPEFVPFYNFIPNDYV